MNDSVLLTVLAGTAGFALISVIGMVVAIARRDGGSTNNVITVMPQSGGVALPATRKLFTLGAVIRGVISGTLMGVVLFLCFGFGLGVLAAQRLSQAGLATTPAAIEAEIDVLLHSQGGLGTFLFLQGLVSFISASSAASRAQRLRVLHGIAASLCTVALVTILESGMGPQTTTFSPPAWFESGIFLAFAIGTLLGAICGADRA